MHRCSSLGAALAALVAFAAPASAGAVVSGFNATSLPRNDDDSTAAVGIGFGFNLFGQNYTQLFVNNNGNVTFGWSLATYTPFGLLSTSSRSLAPFFADVDTRGAASGVAPTAPARSAGAPRSARTGWMSATTRSAPTS
jgi:hypothetical protein